MLHDEADKISERLTWNQKILKCTPAYSTYICPADAEVHQLPRVYTDEIGHDNASRSTAVARLRNTNGWLGLKHHEDL